MEAVEMKKNSLFFTCIDNFLDKDSLLNLQKQMLSVSYKPGINPEKDHYGYEHHFSLDYFKDDPLLKKIKDTFFPHDDLKPVEIRAHLRHNTKKPLPHTDQNPFKEEIETQDFFSFLMYVKGDPLMYNGTGFYGRDSKLFGYIGFEENRTIFFNAGRIMHTDLQALGESSPRYTLNVFYEGKYETQ
tara:strand:- start:118 stop:675 length:558 start_codon:yes stop_codon:yes gene_type:complete